MLDILAQNKLYIDHCGWFIRELSKTWLYANITSFTTIHPWFQFFLVLIVNCVSSVIYYCQNSTVLDQSSFTLCRWLWTCIPSMPFYSLVIPLWIAWYFNFGYMFYSHLTFIAVYFFYIEFLQPVSSAGPHA